MSRFALKTAATSQPVTLPEAKNHLRVDHDDDNVLIEGLIERATTYGQWYLERQFITATWYLYLDHFPRIIEIRKPPVASIVAITYTASDGTASTALSAALYQTDLTSPDIPARIMPAYGQVWPITRSGVFNAVTVEFTAGYGAASTVPTPTKQGILMKIHDLYELTGSEIVGPRVSRFSQTADSLFDVTAWGSYA